MPDPPSRSSSSRSSPRSSSSRSGAAAPTRSGPPTERASAEEDARDGRAPGLNHVRLRGRLAAAPEARELPSGDTVVAFRLVVARGERVRPGAPTVDTLDCAAWSCALRRRLTRLDAGSVLEVEGRLQRRFWRAGGAAASRCEVLVERVAVLTRRRAVAAPGPPVASG